MKLFIYETEWYPVYGLTDHWGGRFSFEMDDAQYVDLKGRYDAVFKAFNNMQSELYDLMKKNAPDNYFTER